ncbi:Uncharacterised protein [Lysinibacillus sphaericus]|uniref:Uncharacterized protein n=1 Tax=Lysinibacillus sphaericus TaxID=1421 RepID=A0AAJ4ZU73_LYSSH|nr:Uncharacterised protein [Lysinibacillus sphaericus]
MTIIYNNYNALSIIGDKDFTQLDLLLPVIQL